MNRAIKSWTTGLLICGFLAIPPVVLCAQDVQERAANQEFDPAIQADLDRRGQLLQDFLAEEELQQRLNLADQVRELETDLLQANLPPKLHRQLLDEHDGLLVWLAGQLDLSDPVQTTAIWAEVIELRTEFWGADHWQVRSAQAERSRSQKIERLNSSQRQSIAHSQQLFQKAESLHQQGDLIESAKSLDAALRIQLELFGTRSAQTAVLLRARAELATDRHEFEESATLLELAVSMAEASLGAEHPLTINCLDDLAFTQRQTGEIALAARTLMRATQAAEKIVGNQHPDYASHLSNLAVLLGEMGQPQQGLKFARQAQEIFKANEEDEALAENSNVIGVLCMRLHDPDAALTAYQQAVKLQKELHGEDDPHYSIALGNAGTAALALKHLPEAESYITESITVLERSGQRDHPDAAERLLQLASLRRMQGRPKEATALVQDACRKLELSLGAQHPTYALALNQWAVLLAEKGQFAQAEDVLLKAAKIQRQKVGENSLELAATLTNLAQVQARQNNRSLARQALNVAGQIAMAGLEQQHPEYAQHLQRAAAVYRDVRELGPAKAALNQAASILEQELGPEHPEYAEVITDLGLVLIEDNEQNRGKSLVEAGHKILLRHLEEKRPEVMESYLKVAQAARLLDQPDVALRQLVDVEALVREQLGANNEKYAEVLLETGKSLILQGDAKQATASIQQAADIYLEQLGAESPRAQTAIELLRLAQSGDRDVLLQMTGRALEELMRPQRPESNLPGPARDRASRITAFLQDVVREH